MNTARERILEEIYRRGDALRRQFHTKVIGGLGAVVLVLAGAALVARSGDEPRDAVLAGGTSTSAPAASGGIVEPGRLANEDDLHDRTFDVAAIVEDGVDRAPAATGDRRPSVQFDGRAEDGVDIEGIVLWSDGCNGLGAAYDLSEDSRLELGEISSSLVGCTGVIGSDAHAIDEVIDGEPTVRVAGDTILLEAGQRRLVLVPKGAVTGPPASEDGSAEEAASPSTTALVCPGPNPACGPLTFDPPLGPNRPPTITITTSPAQPRAGEAVTVTVVVDEPDSDIWAGCSSLDPDASDAEPDGSKAVAPIHSKEGCVALEGYGSFPFYGKVPPPSPGHSVATYEITYSGSGPRTIRYEIVDGSGSTGCGDDGCPKARQELVIEVQPAAEITP